VNNNDKNNKQPV